MPPGTGRWT